MKFREHPTNVPLTDDLVTLLHWETDRMGGRMQKKKGLCLIAMEKVDMGMERPNLRIKRQMLSMYRKKVREFCIGDSK
jgi:hypothetical protein